MRIAAGSIMQETNTFNPIATTFGDFEGGYLWRGEELLEGFLGTKVEMTGFLDALDEVEVEVVPIIAAHPGGTLLHGDFERLLDELVECCLVADQLDGILLSLHGAMATELEPDAEGALLEAVARQLPGVPVAASLDLHANGSSRMLAVGSTLNLWLGFGKARLAESPVRLRAQVTALRNTPFRLDGPGAHSIKLNAGQMTVVTAGQLNIVLCSLAVIEVGPALYRAVGLDPEEAAIEERSLAS